MTTQSITSGQEKQYKRFVEDAAEKALKEVGLDKDGLQKLIENGDEFQARIITGIRELSVSNQFSDEERESSYVYPKGYKPKPLEEQISILRSYWPKIEPGKNIIQLERKPLIVGAEAPFVIVKWYALAPSYNDGLEKEILPAIKTQCKGNFYNWREGKLGEQYLRQHERTAKKLQVLGDQQKDYDILVVPVQFGLRHRGRSVRRAREVFTANEFGLGAFEIGCMLLTHPERLVSYDDLWIDCAGNEYGPGADGDFSDAPFFDFGVGEVGFGADWFGHARSGYSSASGFLPQ